MHGQIAGLAHIVKGAKFAGFEDHLEVGFPAGLLDGGNLIEDEIVFPARNSPREITMSISWAPSSTAKRVSSSLTWSGCLAGWEGSGNRGNLDFGAFQFLPRNAHHARIDTYRGYGGQALETVVQVGGLVAHLLHLAGGIFPFQRSEVDHAQAQPQCLDLGFLLDAPGLEPGHTFLHADLIDGDDMTWIKGRYHTGCRHGAKIGIDNGKLKMENGKWQGATRRPPAARGSTDRLWRGGGAKCGLLKESISCQYLKFELYNLNALKDGRSNVVFGRDK
jgi:hypothetical protein